MRTEQQLVDAMESIAETAPASGRVLAALRETRPRPAVGRRRLTVLVATSVIAILVLAITVSTFVGKRTAEPADIRAAGNWNLIHRINLPAGWGVAMTTVTPGYESTQVTTPNGQRNPSASCFITVWGQGAYTPSTEAATRQPVDVQGHDGFYAAPSKDRSTQAGVFWTYTVNGWANVDCGTTQQADAEMARRVVFEATPIVLPFRLRSLPDGYQVAAVQSGSVADSQLPATSVRLTSIVKAAARPTVTITAGPGTAEAKPGLPGYEQTTIGGLPAILSATDGTLCLNDQGDQICIEAAGGPPADLNVSLWPAGRRELLVNTANSLELAENLNDATEWTDANKAVIP